MLLQSIISLNDNERRATSKDISIHDMKTTKYDCGNIWILTNQVMQLFKQQPS